MYEQFASKLGNTINISPMKIEADNRHASILKVIKSDFKSKLDKIELGYYRYNWIHLCEQCNFWWSNKNSS